MKAAIIGQNWFFFLGHDWVWSSSGAELIDLCLNSTLFSSENNYLQRLGLVGRSGVADPFDQCRAFVWNHIYRQNFIRPCGVRSGIFPWLESEFYEKCPVSRYMKVYGPAAHKLFLLLLTRRLLPAWWWPWWRRRRRLVARCSPHPPAALIAFVSRSPPIYRCNFSNFSPRVVWRRGEEGGGRRGEEVALAAGAAARVNLHRDTAQKKHSETLLSDNLIKWMIQSMSRFINMKLSRRAVNCVKLCLRWWMTRRRDEWRTPRD